MITIKLHVQFFAIVRFILITHYYWKRTPRITLTAEEERARGTCPQWHCESQGNQVDTHSSPLMKEKAANEWGMSLLPECSA